MIEEGDWTDPVRLTAPGVPGMSRLAEGGWFTTN
jgi:hypothetical protein